MAYCRESAELTVSELITNAITASQSLPLPTPIRLWLLSDHTRVLVLVGDGNPAEPVPAAADLNAENGRGLLLVEAISETWGWYFPENLGGKIVWAAIRAELQPEQHPAVPDKPDNPQDAGCRDRGTR